MSLLPTSPPINISNNLVASYGKIKNSFTNNRQLYSDFGNGVLFRSPPTTTKLTDFLGLFGVNPYHTSQGVIINEFDTRNFAFDSVASTGISLGVVPNRTAQNGILQVQGQTIGTWAHPFTIDSSMYQVRFIGTSSTTGNASVVVPGNGFWTPLDMTRTWSATAQASGGEAEISGTLTIRVFGDTSNTPVGTWASVPIFVLASSTPGGRGR